MGRFKTIVGGKMEQKQLTKSELMQAYEGRFKGLGDAIQQLSQIMFRSMSQQGQQIAEIKQQLAVVDVRSLAELELLTEKNLFTTEEHTNRARAIRVREFDKASAEADKAQGLLPVDGAAELGHFVVVEIEGRYPATIKVPSIKEKLAEVSLESAGAPTDVIPVTETVPHPQAGQRIEELSILRSKVEIGSGQLFPELEKAFIGLKVGDEKDITVVIPKAFQKFADQEVVFHVRAFDLRKRPEPKPAEVKQDGEAPTEPQATP